MSEKSDASSGSDDPDCSSSGKRADKVRHDDPHKVEKLARAGEDTGAVEQEE